MDEKITLQGEELKQYEAFKAEQERKTKEAKREENRKAYKQMVDEAINAMFPALMEVSTSLALQKAKVYDAFKDAMELKAELFEVKGDQRSHMFTSSNSMRRIVIGQYVTDAYDDTVNEGIAKVKEFIGSLAKDENSRMLVDAVMKLLSRDQQGNLKASRVMQLRKMAEQSNSDLFIDGVGIIEKAYRPATSKTYVRAQYKDEHNQWKDVPLGMTEA